MPIRKTSVSPSARTASVQILQAFYQVIGDGGGGVEPAQPAVNGFLDALRGARAHEDGRVTAPNTAGNLSGRESGQQSVYSPGSRYDSAWFRHEPAVPRRVKRFPV